MSEGELVTAGGIPVWGPNWVALRKRFDGKEGFQVVLGPHAVEHNIAVEGEDRDVAIEYAPDSESIVILPADDLDASFDTYPLRATTIGERGVPNHEVYLPPEVCDQLNLDYRAYNEADPLIFRTPTVDDSILPLWPEGPQSVVLDGARLLDSDQYDLSNYTGPEESDYESSISQTTFESAAVARDVPSDTIAEASATLRDDIAAEEPRSADRADPLETDETQVRFLPEGTWAEYAGAEYADVIEAVALAHQREADQIAGELGVEYDKLPANSDRLVRPKPREY